MQATNPHSIISNLFSYESKLNFQALATWILTILVVLIGFRFAREAFAALLLKLHELFIQRNLFKL
jgi:hypothetical protein